MVLGEWRPLLGGVRRLILDVESVDVSHVGGDENEANITLNNAINLSQALAKINLSQALAKRASRPDNPLLVIFGSGAEA